MSRPSRMNSLRRLVSGTTASAMSSVATLKHLLGDVITMSRSRSPCTSSSTARAEEKGLSDGVSGSSPAAHTMHMPQ